MTAPLPLKGLFLDGSLICDAIKAFDPKAKVVGPTQQQKFVEYDVIIEGQLPAKLHIYSNNDSTTTLMVKVGKNQPLSQQVGEHIAKTCKKKEFAQRPLSLSHISEPNWNWLLTHLADDHGFKVTEGKVEHGVRFDVKKGSDQVNLNRYPKNGNFLMQGKARGVYSVVATVLCDLIEDKRQVVEAQLKSYEIESVTVDTLYEELHQYLPNGMQYIGATGAAIMAPSLAYMKLEIELPDYSAMAYHALRGLETYMKVILSNYGYPVANAAGLSTRFLKESLLQSIKDKMNCRPTIDAVEKSYQLYNKHRHALFHADANPEFSRVLETKAEAVSIVHEVLRTIEMTASLIPSK